MKHLWLLLLLLPFSTLAQQHPAGRLAPKPLFRDPIFDGAADPVVVWNKGEQKWWMLYTNRRATDTTATGVTWVHGTRIGIAESGDGGATWRYRDTANINYRPSPLYTHWAPDVVEDQGIYHMFLTYVPGIFTDWNHPRHILHLTSPDLLSWQYESTLALATDKVIDASVLRLPDGTWRLWYNNERAGKSIFYADSPDLYHWQDHGPALKERGEGPKVFRWQGRYWMLLDKWQGLAVYSSPDLKAWTPQAERLLELPGLGRPRPGHRRPLRRGGAWPAGLSVLFHPPRPHPGHALGRHRHCRQAQPDSGGGAALRRRQADLQPRRAHVRGSGQGWEAVSTM